MHAGVCMGPMYCDYVVCTSFRRSFIVVLLLKRLDLCMEESTCHEMVIHLSQRFSSMLHDFFHLFIIGLDFRLYDGFDLKTYLLMRW